MAARTAVATSFGVPGGTTTVPVPRREGDSSHNFSLLRAVNGCSRRRLSGVPPEGWNGATGSGLRPGRSGYRGRRAPPDRAPSDEEAHPATARFRAGRWSVGGLATAAGREPWRAIATPPRRIAGRAEGRGRQAP